MPEATTDSRRVPQLTDPVSITVTFPSSTEDWAEELIANVDGAVETTRTQDGLVVTTTINGNCSALANTASFLRDLEDALQEGDIDPMQITVHAEPA